MIGLTSFSRSWRVPGLGGDLFIVLGRGVRIDTRIVNAPPGLYEQIDRWLADPALKPLVLEMYQAIGGTLAPGEGQPGQRDLGRQVKARLADAFRFGELVIMPAPRVAPSGPAEEEPQQAGQQSGGQAAQTQKTWIEIELVDAKGKPVPNERFRIQAPDGQFHTGQLDTGGRARVSGIDAGECSICFPDLDGREWGPAAQQ